MNKYDDIEQLLEKLARENPKEMENIDDIDDAIFDRIEAKAMMSIAAQKPKKGYRFLLKAVAALVVLFGLFSLALYMFDMENTRATEDPTYAPNEMPIMPAHEINIPQYIPDGYNLEHMTSGVDSNGYSTIEMKYISESDEDQYILIRIYGDNIIYSNEYDIELDEIKVNDEDVYIITIYSDPIINYLSFSDGWGDGIQIMTTVDEKTLMKIVESMK